MTNMRTLGIQVRLRRLLRMQAEAADRLAADPSNRSLASAAVARLLGICAEVRQTWALELAGGLAAGDLSTVQRSVARSLSAIEALVAQMERPGADVMRLSAELQDAVVPLIYLLRGLEEPSLARTA
jgi:hypothetical protein